MLLSEDRSVTILTTAAKETNTVFTDNISYLFPVRGVHSCWDGYFLLDRLSPGSQGTSA